MFAGLFFLFIHRFLSSLIHSLTLQRIIKPKPIGWQITISSSGKWIYQKLPRNWVSRNQEPDPKSGGAPSPLRRSVRFHHYRSWRGLQGYNLPRNCRHKVPIWFQVIFDRQAAIRLSGMSEKAYNRSFNSLQNSLGVKTKLDIRELGIQFGCVRLIPFVKNGLSLYKQRFIASLPASVRATADFTRPVFTAVAFYLCAKRHKLKVDKIKLIEVCGTSESEFKCVSISMKDLCHDVFGISKEKKDPREVKGNRELLDVLPEKRKFEDGGYLSDGPELSSYKKRKTMEKVDYEKWKSSVISSNEKNKAKGPCKRTRQTRLDFTKEVPETAGLEAL